MILLTYIVKVSACLAIFLAFYRLALSATIPFLAFPTYIEANPEVAVVLTETVEPSEATTSADWISYIVWSIYFIGVLLMSSRFLINLYNLRRRIQNNPKFKSSRFINVLVNHIIAPHTFFNYIFFNEQAYKQDQIPKEVILHEQAHAKQLHSLDIIFIEIVLIILWFNPLIHLLKRSIKLNHEFLADAEVIKAQVDQVNYQNTLLNFSSMSSDLALVNSINYSSIKKRITVMKSQTSQKSWLKVLLIAPVLALTLYSFSSRIPIEMIPENKDWKVEQGSTSVVEDQKEASAHEVEEYNQLAKKYQAILKKENMRINSADVERMKYLYGKMSAAQREAAQPFPDFPEPPPAPDAPTTPKANPAKLPPPPPPIPDDASPEQKKKYEKATKAYKEAAVKAEKVRYKERVKAKVMAEEAAKVRTKEERAVKAEAKYKIAKERRKEKEERKAVLAEKKMERKELSEERKKEMMKRKLEREKQMQLRKKELALMKEERRPEQPKNPLDHIVDMAKKGATFYLEGRKISSDLAIETVKSNKQVSVETTGRDSQDPKVYITVGKPVIKD